MFTHTLHLRPPAATNERSTAAKPKRRHRSEDFEFRVQYRRAAWKRASQRIFSTERHARRFVAKFVNDRATHLSPIVELSVDRRPVGPWTDVGLDWWVRR